MKNTIEAIRERVTKRKEDVERQIERKLSLHESSLRYIESDIEWNRKSGGACMNIISCATDARVLEAEISQLREELCYLNMLKIIIDESENGQEN